MALRSELAGAGPLEELLRQERVTDVLVNGPIRCGLIVGGLERAAVQFRDESAVRRLAQRLAASANHRLDETTPYVDARLPDGSRLHAILPPVAPAAHASRCGSHVNEHLPSPISSSWGRSRLLARAGSARSSMLAPPSSSVAEQGSGKTPAIGPVVACATTRAGPHRGGLGRT